MDGTLVHMRAILLDAALLGVVILLFKVIQILQRLYP
jgi:hypothetical protein